MIGRGSGGESREKHHLDFQEDVRDTGQELHKNGHREVWQGLSQHGQGGGEYTQAEEEPVSADIVNPKQFLF